jgi:hypothetical protein
VTGVVHIGHLRVVVLGNYMQPHKRGQLEPTIKSAVPSPPIWGCLVITMDCKAGGGSVSVGIGNNGLWEDRDWTRIPTYGIIMETQIAHEVTELSVLQCRASEHRVELVECWEELGGGTDRSKDEKIPWPILFTACCFSRVRFPRSSMASSSRK